jgi:VWFA-related protein
MLARTYPHLAAARGQRRAVTRVTFWTTAISLWISATSLLGADMVSGLQQPAQRRGEKETASAATTADAGEPLEIFSVQLIAPSGQSLVGGKVRIAASVEADRPEAVRSVDFFVDGRMLFSDCEPPYEVTWNAGPPARHLVEVFAYGPGRQETSASLRVGVDESDVSPTINYSARVERVEVYVRIEGKNGEEPEVSAESVEVLEEGVSQPVIAVEKVADLSLAVGLLVDCSGSMIEELDRAVEAGGTFIQGLITQDEDKAFVMSFADLPILMQGFTNDTARLEDALELLKGGNHTALYDSVEAAADQFSGIEGRRALVVLTDGHDEGSESRLQASIEAAQRADIALYPVAVDLSANYFRERWILNRMAEATGGQFWTINMRGDPSHVYEEIAEDLRGQYRITYEPLVQGGAGDWRAIEVRLKGIDAKHVRVRARPGYFSR